MKRITNLFLLGFILFLASPTKAQSPIAVQNDSGTSFYSTLDLAITNAIAGDYIYLPGGTFTISVPIDKQLQIIGVGHNPDSCAVTGITQVTGNILIKNGSDHGLLTGMKISGTVSFGTSAQAYNDVTINYYTIERCNIAGVINLATKSTNTLINECIIHSSITGNYTQGFQMSKCIYETSYIYTFDSNAYFTNNIFLGNGYSNINLYYIKGCSFKNNIFIRYLNDATAANINYSPAQYSYYCSYNNIFQNNLSSSFNLFPSPYNLFQNNITGTVTILFVNQSGQLFDYKQDYHIKTDSPAHNAGTDGNDLGIYGTSNPWKEGSVPSYPHIQSKSISTVNGNLNVKIKVAAQDN